MSIFVHNSARLAGGQKLNVTFKTVLAGVVTAVLLVGCSSNPAPGSSQTPSGSATQPSASESAASPSAAEFIDYEYEGYSAKIPNNPQRVVVLDSRSGLELALLADYPIVATAYSKTSPLSPLISADAAHLKNSAFDLNREEIASYNPDLIVVGSGWWNYYEGEKFELGEIAPVLAVNDGLDVTGATSDNPFVAMTDQLNLLGRTEQNDKAVAQYESTIAQAKAEVGSYLEEKSAGVIHAPEDNFTVISGDSIYQVVLPDLGLKIFTNDEIENAPPNPNGDGHMLSYENAVSALGDADLLFVFKAEAEADLDPLLQRVPAVKDGNWINGNLSERFGFALTYTSFVNGIVDAVKGFDDFS